MKIYIIGAAGSGKTTLAKEISKRLKITHTDLDSLFWDNQKNSFGIRRDKKIRNELYYNILKQESWIIEGAYLSWPSEGFIQADILIFLKLSNRKLTFRILKRFIKRKLGLVHNNKKETFSNLIKLLQWNRGQSKMMNDFFLTEKKPPNLICLSNKKEINDFLIDNKIS